MTIGRIPSVEGGIQPTIVDAKGDILTATAADTPAVLAVGNNGETLVADSSATTGLRWQSVSAVKPNFVVNGNFDFWQRGTSFTASGYTADRWYAVVSGTTTVARESTVIPDGSTYALKWTTGANTSYAEMAHAFEAADVNAMGGKTITVSMKLRAQASFSGDIYFRLQTNTTADTQTGGAWTTVVSTQATPSTSAYNTVTATYTVPVGTKGLRIYVAVGAAQASGTGLYIGQVQLEVGSAATSYKYSGGTLAGELAACQRYLPAFTASGNNAILGFASSTTKSYVYFKLPVTARVAPTGITVSNVTHFNLYNKGFAGGAPTAIAFDTAGPDMGYLGITTTAGSPTIAQGEPASLQFNSASALILFTGCEL